MTVQQPAGPARCGVGRAVEAVLSAPQEPWPLMRLATMAGYSPHHFHRLFVRVMGETPQRFVARTRVERAAAILHSDRTLSVTDAAVAVGVTPSQLSRAFRDRFGIPPSSWDRDRPLNERLHPALAAVSGRRLAIPEGSVALRLLPGFGFAYRRVSDPYGSLFLKQAFIELGAWVVAQGGRSRLIGMSWDDPNRSPGIVPL